MKKETKFLIVSQQTQRDEFFYYKQKKIVRPHLSINHRIALKYDKIFNAKKHIYKIYEGILLQKY